MGSIIKAEAEDPFLKLRNRLLFTVSFILACTVAALYGFTRFVLLKDIGKIEGDYLRQEVRRTLGSLEGDLDELNGFARNWAARDDTRSFIEGYDGDYIRTNLADATFSDNRVNLMLFLDNSGRLVYGKCYDLDGNRPVSVPAGLLERLTPGGLLLRHTTPSDVAKGILVLPEGPLLVVSHPIPDGNPGGPVRGSLIVGRFLDSREVARRAASARISVDLREIGEDGVPSALRETGVSGGDRIPVRPLNAGTVAGYALIRDLYGEPALVLRVTAPRTLYGAARTGFFYPIAAFLLFSLVLLLYLEKAVISRITTLSAGVSRIGVGVGLLDRLPVSGSDELGTLAREINRLLERLDRYQRKLLKREEECRQAAAELQTIFRALPDLYLRFDADGTVLDVKAGWVADLYLPPEKMIGRNLRDISPASVGKRFLQAIETVRDTRTPVVVEYGIPLRMGTQFFEARILPLAEKQTIAVVRNITERHAAEEQLRYLSLHDPLTGLYNRTFFDEELRRLEEGRRSVGLILCDVDGLKLVNDTLGHKAGDALLLAAAGVLKESFRQEDVVAKLGGDEFAILLTDVGGEAMEQAGNRIRKAVERYNAGNPRLPLSISVGWALRSDATKTGVELFKEADTDMYREKIRKSDNARCLIVRTLMRILEERGVIAAEETDRLWRLLAEFAFATGLPERQIRTELRLLALFHDIGYITVPERILLKRGRFSEEERAEMQLHCEMGYHIAQYVPMLFPIAEWILKHHEWWNGRGYPSGIAGEEIPLECRLLAITDAYLAMTGSRPYRERMSHGEAVAELRRCAGIQFDPVLVERFISLFPSL